MAKKSRMGVLKRQRELRRQEQKALKAERKKLRKESGDAKGGDATREDLEGYGIVQSEE